MAADAAHGRAIICAYLAYDFSVGVNVVVRRKEARNSLIAKDRLRRRIEGHSCYSIGKAISARVSVTGHGETTARENVPKTSMVNSGEMNGVSIGRAEQARPAAMTGITIILEGRRRCIAFSAKRYNFFGANLIARHVAGSGGRRMPCCRAGRIRGATTGFIP